jgi:hypothetical protein
MQMTRAKKAPRRRRCRVPAGPERGSGGHRALGQPDGGAARRGQVRRRLRPLVRQGAGRGPHRRRLSPRQHGRHLETWRRAGGDGRRPHGRVVHHLPPIRLGADRRAFPGAQPRGRAGNPRPRPLRARAQPVRRGLGGPEADEGHGGGHGGRRWPPRPDAVHLSRVRDAQGRAQHPPGRSLDRAGGTPAALQALRGGGLRPCQRRGQTCAWQTGREDRLRRGGQELARPRLGARRARDRRGGGRAARHHHLQGGPDLAARHEGVQGLGRGAGADRRRGRKAQADRGAGQGGDLRRPPRAAASTATRTVRATCCSSSIIRSIPRKSR